LVKLSQRESPNAINQEEIDREKNNGYQRDNGRIFYVIKRRPGNTLHFRTHIAQEMRQSIKRADARSAQTAFPPHSPSFCTLTEASGARRWK
jgi:hypothetical protein